MLLAHTVIIYIEGNNINEIYYLLHSNTAFKQININ